MSKFFVYSDGGARGNPGQAAYGYLIKFPISNFPRPQCLSIAMAGRQFPNKSQTPNSKNQTKYETIKGSKYIGIATNNQAEYRGILAALKEMVKLLNGQIAKDQPEIVCYLDSKLIVEQMNGNYKVKNEGLKPLYWEIRSLIMELGENVKFIHIPREENCEADKLVNKAIDKVLK